VPFEAPKSSKDELVRRLLTDTLPRAVVGAREPIQWPDVPIEGDDTRARFERAARGLVGVAAPFVRVFPDTALLRVRAPASGGEDLVYTIVRNRAHLNIDFMFLEQSELVPAEDTLHVVRGIVTSRPNFFLSVSNAAEDIEGFVSSVKALSNAESWKTFLDRYGSRRSDPLFWNASDFFNSKFRELEPIDSGVLDLSLYTND
jgi:hypothetical protein